MKLKNVEVKSIDGPLLQVNAEFVTIRDAYSVCRYFNELVRRNGDVEILPKSNNCCKPITQPKIPVPEKIFRCGNATTVIWKDGTKTTVKLMPGAEDSDYGAFTAALAKKIYGNNSKVMKYAGMVQRVKSKAEKKATRKLKRKYEERVTGEKKYIVSQYGQVAECKGIETDSTGVGEKVIAYVESVEDAKRKAINDFKRSLNAYIVYSNGKAEPSNATVLVPFFGTWAESSLFDDAYFTLVFANSREEALKILEINPAPKEGDKP